MKHIVIIGNGISGITTARYVRKMSDHRITVISSETRHFFSRTALMYVYMGHMEFHHIKPYEDWFWDKNKIGLIHGYVEKVDFSNKKLHIKDGTKVSYDNLVLASGSVFNKFGWPGEDLNGVCGMYSYHDLQEIEKYTKNIQSGVIVGGGLIGIELAEMLHSKGIHVAFLVRESSFWNGVLPEEESALINRHIRKHQIDLRLNTELKEIVSDDNGRVKAVTTQQGETIDCQFAGLTAGVRPNIGFLKNSGIETDNGILVDEYFQTNVPDVFAIGDCAQHRNPPGERKAVEQVWYTGRIHGETLAHTLCGRKMRYNPGIWFNSAKFFDIEYQTYGWVWNQLRDNEEKFYWEDANGKRCLKFVFDKKEKNLLGVNALGIRLRHDLIEKWIKERRHINAVIKDLKEANFDPEFSGSSYNAIREKFEMEFSGSKQTTWN